jgi:hypothetical protein
MAFERCAFCFLSLARLAMCLFGIWRSSVDLLLSLLGQACLGHGILPWYATDWNLIIFYPEHLLAYAANVQLGVHCLCQRAKLHLISASLSMLQGHGVLSTQKAVTCLRVDTGTDMCTSQNNVYTYKQKACTRIEEQRKHSMCAKSCMPVAASDVLLDCQR